MLDDLNLRSFVVLLDVNCGLIDKTRLLEPLFEFRDDVVLIGIPIRVATWGPTRMPCPAPDRVAIVFDEPLNGRAIEVMTRLS